MAPKALTDCPENLRESIDWLVQVKHGGGISKLSSALGKLFDHVAQDAQKSLSSPSESDDPSAGDVISKLQGFRSSLPQNSANTNENILHNLCSSVAKFVGYKPPGTYDGSGIVYGDACRLCDAIIEFLHSALSDVYENQPYVAGRAALSGVVGELGKARWRGHHGFKTAVPKVAGGLGEYNKKVKASNEKVRKPIDDVIAFVKDGGELSRGINDLQVSDTSTPSQDEQTVEAAASLVDRCKEVARDFSKKLESAKTAIGDLNPKLRSKLENARKSFFNHVGWLSKWSRKGQKKKLDEMIHKIKTRLRRLGKEVKDRIKQEVHALVELLKERVRKIKRKLEDISESLAKYVQDLVKWMDDAKLYINEVKKYVDKILEEIYGDDKKKIDEAAGKIDKTLSDKVTELTKWIEAADAAVQAAKVKAEQVHGRLDHSDNNGHPKTPIGQGVKQIRDAKDKVKQVDQKLSQHINELNQWKDAASGVLTTAVGKAKEVRDKLNPDAKSTAAEKKAKEAYDKLKVNKTLDENVKKIVQAKDRINDVHEKLNSVHSSLGEWKDQARDVLQGAIGKANEVRIILSARMLRVWSSGTLPPRVSLARRRGDSKKAKIENRPEGKIYVQAQELQKKGKELLEAARTAKKAVESKVTAALKAVVAMDTSLKRDLKQVKEKITNAIKLYVEKQINELPAKVQEDLQQLRGNIEGLASNVLGDRSADDLVKDAFTQLDAAKNALARYSCRRRFSCNADSVA
ncbi:Extracellular matrix-binding ebh, putative [Babesia ovata]|uniref:Extracellular matrix-binding ebh, putative n=1 Tax=Babesia ovata TaxID=189622 RepID=A0A2H6KKL9_9APIC|nr:Extracellular matrix-binding ebh, putative [Babesia ovata]GBE63527.1 Extracellular matrix-binding ebh, putative [Babesia ovata]